MMRSMLLAAALLLSALAAEPAHAQAQPALDGTYYVTFGTWWYVGDSSCAYFADERFTFQTIQAPTSATLSVNGNPVTPEPFTLWFREYFDEKGRHKADLDLDYKVGNVLVESWRNLELREDGLQWVGSFDIHATNPDGSLYCDGGYLMTATRQ